MSSLRPVAVTLALSLLLVFPPSVTAAGPDQPEITDGTGDVQVLQLAWPDALKDVRDQIDQNASSYDLVKGYVLGETRESFQLAIEVADMDAGLAAPETESTQAASDKDTPLLHADYRASFTVKGAAYYALAEVRLDGEQVLSNFTLHTDDEEGTLVGNLSGSVSPHEDRILFHIEKALVGAPDLGDTLTGFYLTSGHGPFVVDQAPDAELGDVAGGKLTQPTYGADYGFGQYDGAIQPAFTLAAFGETAGEAKTGEAMTFHFTLDNQAKAKDTILLTTRGLSGGWSVLLESNMVALEPGANTVVSVDVTPTEGAGKVGVLIIKATSSLGDLSRELPYTVKHDQAARSGGGDATGGGDTTTGAGPSGPEQSLTDEEKENKDSPGIGLAAVLLGLLGLVAVGRVRRR
ncbi:MAG: hypothetical protein KY455_02520 [Euryarchaeota archaeon]|nr:hypothetical protein [Euryarchaeota archaeon]